MNANTKYIAFSVLALIGFIVVAYYLTNKPAEQKVYPELTRINTPEASPSGKLRDHTLGKGKHVMIEYSDLQCPACKTFHEYLNTQKKTDKAFAKIMNENYTFAYRHFPLVSIHKNAELAAQAAEAAGIQGQFYAFLDKAFAAQSEWSTSETPREDFEKIAKELRIDVNTFLKDIDSAKVKDKVTQDLTSGEKVGVNSTPSFYIDGEKLSDFGNLDDLKKVIMDKASQ